MDHNGNIPANFKEKREFKELVKTGRYWIKILKCEVPNGQIFVKEKLDLWGMAM